MCNPSVPDKLDDDGETTCPHIVEEIMSQLSSAISLVAFFFDLSVALLLFFPTGPIGGEPALFLFTFFL